MRAWRAFALMLALVAVPLAGCIGATDPGEDLEQNQVDDMADEAPFELPAEITGLDLVADIDLDGSGNGVWIDEERDLLFHSRAGAGLAITDISDPANPVDVGSYSEVYGRDVDLLTVDDRHFALLSGAGEGIHVVDVTDPSEPVLTATADEYSSHNLAALPGTPYVYNAQPIGTTTDRVVSVLDLTTPEDPAWHTFPIPVTVNGQPVQSDGCHDVTVRPDLGLAFCAGGGGYYVAGGGETFIWDISEDPLAPSWEGIIDNPSIMYHHQALASEDGSLLLINDEFLAPNCQAADTPVMRVGQTTAAMWVYDISDPSSPELLSWVQADHAAQSVNCGSHFGDLVDGTDLVSWGWYQGGTLLIDISDPMSPEIVDHMAEGQSIWDARYHEGHIYASGGSVEVLQLV